MLYAKKTAAQKRLDLRETLKKGGAQQKFRTLADGIVTAEEQDRFLEAVQRLAELGPGELDQLNVQADPAFLSEADLAAAPKGLF